MRRILPPGAGTATAGGRSRRGISRRRSRSRSPTLRGWSSATWSGAEPVERRRGGGQDLRRHRAEVAQGLVPVGAAAEVDLGDRLGAEQAGGVDQGGQLDGVPGGHREPLEQVPADGPLAGQRLHQPAQLGPLQRDQRTRDQLGDPAALERGLAAGVLPRGPLVEPLHQRDAVVGQQRSEQARDEVGVPVDQVGVHEHDQVAAGDEQRLPHRLALARVAAELGPDLVRAVHDGPGVGGHREGVVGRVGVDDHDLVEQAPSSPSAPTGPGSRRPRRWPPRCAPARPGWWSGPTPPCAAAGRRGPSPASGGCARSRVGTHPANVLRAGRASPACSRPPCRPAPSAPPASAARRASPPPRG